MNEANGSGISMPRRKWPRRLALGLAAFVAVFLIWLGYIGAFGGQLYFDLPPQRKTPAQMDGVAAVVFSGDMGFKVGMGSHIADRLSDAGIPVTGVSSLVYFRTRRSPEEARDFIREAMNHALRQTGARKLVLIGQSYGADMLHVGLALLPPEERAKIVLVQLVVPTDTLYFRITPSELFEWGDPDALAMPTAQLLDWVPVLCVRGQEEDDSICPRLNHANVEQLVLPGGHPLHWDSERLGAELLKQISRTLGTAASPRGQ